MFLRVYNLCFPFIFLALLPGYLWRMVRRGDYRAQFGQRLGWYSPEVKDRLAQGPPRLWIQAVSVGEMLIALKFIASLRHLSPGLPLILSTTTTTGFRLAQERAGENVEVIYTPIDLLSMVRRAFQTLRPAAVVIVDGGLWPNILAEAHRRKLPIALVNARLSPRSERRFRRFPRLTASIFRLLNLVCVSEGVDVDRWTKLGVPPDRIHHTGSIKYDDHSGLKSAAAASGDSAGASARMPWQSVLATLGVSPDRTILLAGSTHPGEERILAESYRALRKQFPDLFLIIAPRHVERTSAILNELAADELNVCCRTSIRPGTNFQESDRNRNPPDLLLLDTTGELNDWYAAASVVFIGKSLTTIGGQNPAEAIMAGKPVITGPHMENFGDLMESLLAHDAVIQVADAEALQRACGCLLSDADLCARITSAAARQLDAHRGASARSAALVLARAKISTC